MTTILVVDDHELFRAGLQHLLQDLERDVTVIHASNASDATRCLEQTTDIDLLILDLALPGKNGLEFLKDVVSDYPLVPPIILSSSQSKQDMQQCMDCGAMGYIHKGSSTELMIQAIKVVLAGGLYFPVQLGSSFRAKQRKSEIHGLTPRHIEVLEFVELGLSNKDIARRLHVAESTIKMHVSAIFKALEVTNRVQASKKAKLLGIIS